MASPSSDRLNSFKNKGKANPEELRKKRNELSVALRKKKAEDHLFKRRHIQQSDGFEDELVDVVSTDTDNCTDNEKYYKEIVLSAQDDTDPVKQFRIINNIRRLLSQVDSSQEELVNTLVRWGIVPTLIKCMQKPDNLLKFEAIWAITNIVSGTTHQTMAVVNAGAIPILIENLNSPEQSVCEQSMWALSNIIGESLDLRDIIVNAGIIKFLLEFLTKKLPPTFVQNISWTICNICKGREKPLNINAIKQILPALKYLIVNNDGKVVADSCWALSFLSDLGNEKIQIIIDNGFVPFLIPLLSESSENSYVPALRVLGNIVTGTHHQTQVVLNHGILDYMHDLLTHPKEKIRKEAMWILSNITAGTEHQIQAVLDIDLLPLIIENLTHGTHSVKKEATYTISNMTVGATSQQIWLLIISNSISPLCQMLKSIDASVLMVALEALQQILKKSGPHLSLVTRMIEECNGLPLIEDLQEHVNLDIYKLAFDMIDEFFSLEDHLEPLTVSNTNAMAFDF